MQKFKIRIKELREAIGLTQDELAKKLNVSQQCISSWESGQRILASDKLPALAEALKCKITDLFEKQ